MYFLISFLICNCRYILVYRLGGISCDATVLYVNSGLVSIVASEHTKAIGGYKLIETLKAHLIEEVKRYFSKLTK